MLYGLDCSDCRSCKLQGLGLGVARTTGRRIRGTHKKEPNQRVGDFGVGLNMCQDQVLVGSIPL